MATNKHDVERTRLRGRTQTTIASIAATALLLRTLLEALTTWLT